MTIKEKTHLAILLIQYLQTCPLSHRKRDIVTEIALLLIREIAQTFMNEPTDIDQIPF